MSTVEQIQQQILALGPAERSQLAGWMASTVPLNRQVAPGIDVHPETCGGDPRIAGTRIPVWSLVAYRKLGATDQKLLDAYPFLTLANLANAWDYYEQHREEIERQIAENEEA